MRAEKGTRKQPVPSHLMQKGSLLILNSVVRCKDEDDSDIKTVDTVQKTVSNIYKTSTTMRNRYS
jgi:hypothetical protein